MDNVSLKKACLEMHIGLWLRKQPKIEIDEDDKIKCYITQEEVDWWEREVCWLNLIGFLGKRGRYDSCDEMDDNIEIEQLNLNKSIYYIFDGITFSNGINIDVIHGGGITIIFRNCTFKDGIFIKRVNEVIFENNQYFNTTLGKIGYIPIVRNVLTKHFLTIDSSVDKVTFKDEYFKNTLGNAPNPYFYPEGFGMSIKAAEVSFLNSTIETYFPSDITAKSLKLIDSTIMTTEISVNSDSITNENSIISVTEGVLLDNKNCDFKGTIEAPLVIYNGEDITECSPNKINVIKKQPTLENVRQDLVYTLRKIKTGIFQRTIVDIINAKPYTKK